MTSEKTLLIISGGEEAANVARRAKESGITIVMSDADPGAPGFAFADSCLIADAFAPTETAAAAERYNRKIRRIDGVLGMVASAPVTAATVAQRLRLPGLPIHVAELVQDRLAMKKTFVSAGIASPWFAEVRTPQDLQRAVIAQGRELTIIPLDGRGAGMQRLAQVEDLAGAFMHVRSQSASERVMVEKCLDGPRLFAPALISGGGCVTPCLFDRTAEGETASRQPEEMQSLTRDLIARAAAALGIGDGPVTADIVIHQGQPFLLAMSAGLSGGHPVPLPGGGGIIEAAIQAALKTPAGAPQ